MGAASIAARRLAFFLPTSPMRSPARTSRRASAPKSRKFSTRSTAAERRRCRRRRLDLATLNSTIHAAQTARRLGQSRHGLRIVPCQHARSIAQHDEPIGIFVGDDAIKGTRAPEIVIASQNNLNVSALTAAKQFDRIFASVHAFLPR